jgi:D-galactarolactone isomerase
MIARRAFLKGASMAALGSLGASPARAQPVSNSAGTARPKHKAPANACDCHMHIYDPERFPMPPSKRVPPANATVAHYRALQQRLGTTRTVVVQPRNYAIDNRVTLDAIAQLGDARGVAVLHPTVGDAELKALHAGGIRGIRFTLGDPATAVVKPDMIEPLAKRIAGLGWHIQFNVEGEQVIEFADIFRRLPTPMVFDHLGNPTLPAGIEHRSHAVLRDLVDQGRAWVKLSGAYSNSKSGPPYPEATRTARAWVAAAPERLVWGSDWPHPTERNDNKPDDAFLFDLLAEWAPNEATRRRILVANPEALYGFTPSRG